MSDMKPAPVQVAGPERKPILEAKGISKAFGHVQALNNVDFELYPAEVVALIGDNGAGKSTLVKILSGIYRKDSGQILSDGKPVDFRGPKDAEQIAGISTVYQDLAMIPLMSVSRNFFLGSEPTTGWGIFKRFDVARATRIVRDEMLKMGIDVRDPDQPVGTLSGGERQSVAIARAVYFGAKVLILDEPTSALGVKQAGTVLKYIAKARAQGVAVIFITHNPHHAFPIGNRFTILKRGRALGTFRKTEISRDEMIRMMSGVEELENLEHELRESSEDVFDEHLADALRDEEESL